MIGVNMLVVGDNRPDMLEVSFNGVSELYNEGILKPHIGKVFTQGQLGDAQAHMEDRKSIGKIIVTWDAFEE